MRVSRYKAQKKAVKKDEEKTNIAKKASIVTTEADVEIESDVEIEPFGAPNHPDL